MPRLPDQQQQSPQYFYQQHHQNQYPQAQSPIYQSSQQPQSRQISPLSTSNNGSPTQSSSASGNAPRLRPIFMPAVLRPNEFPSRHDPTTKGDEDQLGSPRSSGLFTFAFGRLARRSTGDSGKCLDQDDDDDDDASININLDLFPQPTAQPTRSHWKPDLDSTHCDEPSCMRNFNYWTRRHHCRKCGNIFCDTHSGYGIPLDQDANYNPRSIPSRACRHCYTNFKSWRSRTNSQASSENSSVVQGPHTAPSSPLVANPAAIKGKAPATRQEVAMSVPRDWNWSTF